MRSKKLFLVLLIISSIILPTLLISSSRGDPTPANDEISWGVRQDRTYTWLVKQSTEIFGFLPEDSEIEITITSIRALGGGSATELNATISLYNSVTESTTTLLDNETFIYFDSATNTTTLYTLIDDHGFFLPPDYINGFKEGLINFYGSFFNPKGYGTTGGMFHFWGYRSSTDLVYMWTFNKNGITDNFVAVDIDDEPDDPEDFQYWLVLKSGSDSIPLGNFFLIFTSLAILSLIYIHKKRVK